MILLLGPRGAVLIHKGKSVPDGGSGAGLFALQPVPCKQDYRKDGKGCTKGGLHCFLMAGGGCPATLDGAGTDLKRCFLPPIRL